jgi:hypothetical protein
MLTPRVLTHLLTCLFELDLDYLREHPETPALYRAGVRYRREPEGQERWASIPIVRRLGFGDCEDLATWRAAELVVRGERARPISSHQRTPRGILYHIRVLRADGRIEDPSRILGMGAKA